MANLNSVLLLALAFAGVQSLKINKSTNIEINTFTSSEHLFVELAQLEGLSKARRVEFVNLLISKYGQDLISFKNID